ncbi:MAG: FMN reductase [Bacteroidetes bacterium]|nr:MAG: FMN reductase [Bacteroidota bacterium]
MSKTAVIFGSSRSEGNTASLAHYIGQQLIAPVFAVGEVSIAPYHYEHIYPAEDGYYALMEQLVKYDRWIMLTPVYWYTMSAQLKLFWDRKSDLLRVRKDLGGKLSGTKLWVICCSSDASEYDHFFTPFRLSAAYLNMDYQNDLHLWGGRVVALMPEVKMRLDAWLEKEFS